MIYSHLPKEYCLRIFLVDKIFHPISLHVGSFLRTCGRLNEFLGDWGSFCRKKNWESLHQAWQKIPLMFQGVARIKSTIPETDVRCNLQMWGISFGTFGAFFIVDNCAMMTEKFSSLPDKASSSLFSSSTKPLSWRNIKEYIPRDGVGGLSLWIDEQKISYRYAIWNGFF